MPRILAVRRPRRTAHPRRRRPVARARWARGPGGGFRPPQRLPPGQHPPRRWRRPCRHRQHAEIGGGNCGGGAGADHGNGGHGTPCQADRTELSRHRWGQCRGGDAGCGDPERLAGAHADGCDVDSFVGLADSPPGSRLGAFGDALQRSRRDGVGIGDRRTVRRQRRIAVRHTRFDEPLRGCRVVPVMFAHQAQVVGITARVFCGDTADRPVVRHLVTVRGVVADGAAAHLSDRCLGGCARQVDIDVDRRAVPPFT